VTGRVWHRARAPLAGALVLLAAALTYPGADVVALAAGAGAARAGAQATGDQPTSRQPGAGWLHVAHPAGQAPFIADARGRRVTLRGAAVAGLVDYWSAPPPGTGRTDSAAPPFYPLSPAAYANACPADSPDVSVPPLCRDDLAEMRALGFNVVEVSLSWSLLEPRPGFYDPTYLDRIAQVVGWAEEQGLHVILRMEQNAYSRFIPGAGRPPALPGGTEPPLRTYSGAPAWATLSDGFPFENYLNQREVDPAVSEATTSFWLNRDGLQDHYIGALAALAQRFRDSSTVAGYDLFDEPWPGWSAPPEFEDLQLFPFYRRAIDALTAVGDGLPCPSAVAAIPVCGYRDLGVHDRRHLIFVEPDLLRVVMDLPTHLPLPVSSYPNVVLSIHAYTHQYTVDALLGQPPSRAGYPPGGYDQAYATAEWEARAMDAPLSVGEFGNDPARDSLLLAGQLREQERHLTGGILWVWKENCSPARPWGVYAGLFGSGADQRCAYDRPPATAAGPYPQSGCLRAGRERLLARVYPEAAAGRVLDERYDPGSGAFRMTANAGRGAPDTLVVVPPEVRGAPGVTGAATLAGVQPTPGGGRLLRVRPLGGGYTVAVSAAPLALRGCP
jgi:endoglycosylceramidase